MKTSNKGFNAFNTLYIIGIVFAIGKLIDYLQWTFQLVKKWNIPEQAFFSKVSLLNSDVEISVTAYLLFAIAYIVAFGFIILGLYQLKQTSKLFAEKKIFHDEVGSAFKKAGKSFLTFAFGTLAIDVLFLFWAKTSNRIIDLLSTELLVFVILGYLMFFLSDIFNEGISIREENELTI